VNRQFIALVAGIPALLLVALLLWSTVSTNGSLGRPGVNDKFGRIELSTPYEVDFNLDTLSGNHVQLSALRDQIVMVDFWSSWCPPCIQEGPVLAQAYGKWHGQGVEFVGIAIWDDETPIRDFINKHNTRYPNAMDPTGSTAIDFGVKGLPEKFFFNRQGQVVRKYIGPITATDLDSILSTLITVR